MKIKFYAYKRYRGWDFLPQITSHQMHGKRDYDYKHFYSASFELRAFRYVAGFQITYKGLWELIEGSTER